jgi:hypothetical protein
MCDKTVSEGAGQVRAISRLALNSTIKTGRIRPLYDSIDDLFRKTGKDMKQAMRVVIASTASGGTGSGIILPLSMFIRDYVKAGGALLMVGGYMSFSGVDARAKYGHTALKDVLPVKCLEVDDLMEHPEGIYPEMAKEHPALKDVPKNWPHFLGYNKTVAIPEGEVAMTIDGDPFIAFADFGEGRSAMFASDCAPHWGPPEFVNWEGYTPLWKGIVDYITRS